MPIDCRQLRQHITIQDYTRGTANEFNEKAKTYTNALQTVARVQAVGTPREQVIAKSFKASCNWKVTIRYWAGLAPEQRIVWGNRILHIDGIIPDEHKRQQEIYCTEVV